MVAFRRERAIQELCEPELFFGELVEELSRGDFKSKLDQTMICASGLCNRVMQCSGVWSGCKWDNTQMNDSLPFGSAGLPNKDQPNTKPLGYDTPIFLIGMMGAGKTTIGRHLTRIRDRAFVDLEHHIRS